MAGKDTIRVVTEASELEDPIFDSRDPQTWVESYEQGAVYLIETDPDGRLLAFDRDYGLIGTVQMTDAEFRNRILPFVFATGPSSRNVWSDPPGDSYWLEADEEVRASKLENSLY